MTSKEESVGIGDSLGIQAFDAAGNPIDLSQFAENMEEVPALPGPYAGTTWVVLHEDRGWYVADANSGGEIEVIKGVPMRVTGQLGVTTRTTSEVPPVPVTIDNQTFFDSEDDAKAARANLIASMGGEDG